MDVKPGYKQTEVGLIPEDWEVSALNALVSSERKITYGIVIPGPIVLNGVPMIRAQDYSKGWVALENLYRVSPDIDKAYKRSKVINGDVLLTIVGSVGNVSKVPPLFCGSNITQQTARLSFNSKVAEADYYLNILQFNIGKNQISNYTKSGVQPSLNLADIEKFILPLPPLPEQTAIATALSDADALIESLEQLIAKKSAIKQGAMQELLTGKRRLPGFGNGKGYKQTEVGTIPEDWPILNFREIVSLYIDYRGRTPKKLGMDWGNGDILALSANNVQMGKIDPSKEPTYGSEELYRKWMLHGECKPNDVLLTMEAPLGNIARIPDTRKYILSQRVLLIRPQNWIDSRFLSFFMMGRFFQNQLQFNSSGTTAKGIQRRKLDLISIYLPIETAEQTAIFTVLSDMDSEIESLETKLNKTRQIKQGMMSELLTGRIRLI
jgi:type I restriction enzyme S subunit